MNKKKTLSLILSVVLAFSLSLPAFAANPTSGTMNITVTKEAPPQQDPTYTVTIPEDVELEYGAESTDIGKVSVSNLSNIADGYAVRVLVNDENATLEKSGSSSTIPFAVAAANQSRKPGSPLFFELTSTDKETPELSLLICESDWEAAEAGDYSGSLTFTFGYANTEYATAQKSCIAGAGQHVEARNVDSNLFVYEAPATGEVSKPDGVQPTGGSTPVNFVVKAAIGAVAGTYNFDLVTVGYDSVTVVSTTTFEVTISNTGAISCAEATQD